ncbi:MAG: hypothetical protein RLZZ331_1446, partial [Pseudomonadota bacterium]
AGTSTYDFTTAPPADTTAPVVTAVSPADGATNVASSSNLVVTFNEPITRGIGAIEIRSGSATGTVVESFNASTSTRLSISGSTLTIDPTNNLADGTQYVVVMSAGAIRDLAGNSYPGFNGYDFTTAPPANVTVTGTSGDDRLVSQSANETINGLGGLDTLVYSGARLDYEISRANGIMTVRDLRPQGNGTDTLTNVERLEFTDGLMGLIPEELVLFLPGSRDLITWDSTQGSNGFSYFFRLGASSTVAAVADFTGDGRADVLISQPGGGLIRWDPTLGGNGFAVLPAAPGFEVIGKGDLVGNSATDLLLKNAAGQLRILDPVAGTITDLFGLASGWSVAGVANINGSGKDDVILQNNSTGAVVAFTDQGWRDLITLGSGWEIAGLGDVTGGLADDFILQKADGVTIFWDATQGGNGWKDFATIGPAWDFAGFNDLNGDGRDDVVLQNDNGLAIYWTGSNWVDLGSTLIGTEMVGTGVFP